MQAFDLAALIAVCEKSAQSWYEFLRMPSLSMGIYRLKAGQADRQQPHTEDEAYYIVSGQAMFRAGDQVHAAAPGTVLVVERHVEHRFFDIREDLTVLVFFAPAEGSLHA